MGKAALASRSRRKAKSKVALPQKKAKRQSRKAGVIKTRKQWSAQVMKVSDAMDLKKGIFTQSSGLAIARSLKKSAERSTRRKSTPFRSAMSMLNFEINRGGKGITPARRRVLERAKVQLRKLFQRA